MRQHYDFSNARPNPYARLLKRQVTLRLDEPTLEYFKSLSQEMSIPYRTLDQSLPKGMCRLQKAPAIDMGASKGSQARITN